MRALLCRSLGGIGSLEVVEVASPPLGSGQVRIGVRASGNWVAYTGGMFAFFLAVPLWYLARRRRVESNIRTARRSVPNCEASQS